MKQATIIRLPAWVRLGILILGISVILLAGYVVRQTMDLSWSVDVVRSKVQSFGVWGPVAFVLLVAFRFIFLLPISIVLVSSGLVFGPLFGTLWAGLGLILSALLKWATLLLVGPENVTRLIPEKHRSGVLNRLLAVMNPLVLTGACAYPFFPKHIFQIAALLAGMSGLVFLACVSLGAFIRAAFFAGFGQAMTTGTHFYPYAVAVVAVFAIPLLFPSLRRAVFNLSGVQSP